MASHLILFMVTMMIVINLKFRSSMMFMTQACFVLWFWHFQKTEKGSTEKNVSHFLRLYQEKKLIFLKAVSFSWDFLCSQNSKNYLWRWSHSWFSLFATSEIFFAKMTHIQIKKFQVQLRSSIYSLKIYCHSFQIIFFSHWNHQENNSSLKMKNSAWCKVLMAYF